MRSDAALAPIRHALRKQQGVARGAGPSQPGRSQPAWVGPASLGGASQPWRGQALRAESACEKIRQPVGPIRFFLPTVRGVMARAVVIFCDTVTKNRPSYGTKKFSQGRAKPSRAEPSQPGQGQASQASQGGAKPARVGPASLGGASQLGRGQPARAEPACQKIRQPTSQGQFDLFRIRSGKF